MHVPIADCIAQKARRPAPPQSFVVEDAWGRKTDVLQQRGKVVFVNFWALSCPPCKAEMPTIDRLREHFRDDTTVLIMALDVDHNFSASMRYFAEQGFSLSVHAPAGVVPRTLFAGVLPTTAVIDRSGKVAFLQQGEGQYDSPQFLRLMDSLVALPPAVGK